MDDLISRKEALKALEQARIYVSGLRSGKTILAEYAKQCREMLISSVRNVNGVDAEYVRHGAWITVGKSKNGTVTRKCSSCGIERKGINKSAYCRDCGAKMDLLECSEETVDALLNIGRNTHTKGHLEPLYVLDEEETFEQETCWTKENPYLKKESTND